MKEIWKLGLFCSLFFVACSAPQSAEQESATPEEAVAPSGQPEQAANRGTAEITLGEASVRIDYGRPELKGRDMKLQAEPGFVWRLGMNEATTIESNKELAFGDKIVPAGTHTIFARMVDQDQWELVFNSETGLWGAFDYNPEKNVAEIPLTLSPLKESVERFTIELNSTGDQTGEILFRWGHDQLKAAFTVR